MSSHDPALQALVDRVQAARADRTPLHIRGGGSKAFYGEPSTGEALDVTALRGISSYEPTELVVTARCGTPLAELEAVLAERGQCLPFEPPHFGAGATVGGMVAAGLSGPPRAAVGSVRDYVLGATLLNGRGEVLSFGGQVMKNVAGYDVSRLLAGSMGTLGVILEVSLKVLPVAPATATMTGPLIRMPAASALQNRSAAPICLPCPPASSCPCIASDASPANRAACSYVTPMASSTIWPASGLSQIYPNTHTVRGSRTHSNGPLRSETPMSLLALITQSSASGAVYFGHP